MRYDEFRALCDQGNAPSLAPTLFALWQDYRGDWDGAHTTVQNVPTTDGSLVHAYLHRKEGDLGNSRYWYNRAGEPMADSTLAEEWESIAHRVCD